jgi:hypothetical protein
MANRSETFMNTGTYGCAAKAGENGNVRHKVGVYNRECYVRIAQTFTDLG